MLARKTWSFFETFVTAKDNWLPPDNYQEEPVERIAHRTSPTNIGMALLSNLTAYDFGYITGGQLIERTSNTIRTVQGMEKYRGHLYNWYDTETLMPLAPKYISTVDSGNMAGHLITLKQGLLIIADKKISDASFFEGLADILYILKEKAASANARAPIDKYLRQLTESYPATLNSLAESKKYIDELEYSYAELLDALSFPLNSEELWWAQKGTVHISEAKKEISALCPWLVLPPAPEKFAELIPMLPVIPSIKQLAKVEEILLNKIVKYDAPDNTGEENGWLNNFRVVITAAARRAKELSITLQQLAVKCNEIANIEFDFLYYRSQHLLTIGYNVDEQRKDNGFYDLLASEARLTTFVAIAQGKLPQDSWFALGRQLTNIGTIPVLLSWSGSMFEYLMPLLVMPTYENTLLHQTYKAIIQSKLNIVKEDRYPGVFPNRATALQMLNLIINTKPLGYRALALNVAWQRIW